MAMINMFMPQKREILIKGGSYKTIMDGVIEAESYNHNTNLYSFRTSLSPNTTTIDASSNIDSVIKFNFFLRLEGDNFTNSMSESGNSNK